MNTLKEFKRMMKAQNEIALATSNNGQPNVRIVNFYYDEIEKVIYFSTFSDNQKISEFICNDRIAFTTIPLAGVEHVKAQGTVIKSSRSIYDVEEEFTQKIEGYDETITQAGEYLELFEIRFTEAVVTLDFENIETLEI
ncbi:MAG: pyridoxamine 5'-phosphate oxidase family protein [Lachnospiraceae bacterium]